MLILLHDWKRLYCWCKSVHGCILSWRECAKTSLNFIFSIWVMRTCLSPPVFDDFLQGHESTQWPNMFYNVYAHIDFPLTAKLRRNPQHLGLNCVSQIKQNVPSECHGVLHSSVLILMGCKWTQVLKHVNVSQSVAILESEQQISQWETWMSRDHTHILYWLSKHSLRATNTVEWRFLTRPCVCVCVCVVWLLSSREMQVRHFWRDLSFLIQSSVLEQTSH